jgi:hypothetical protein
VAAERQRAAHEGVIAGDVDDVDGKHDAERHRRVAGAAVTGAADKQHEAHRRRECENAQEQDAVLQPSAGEPDEGADRGGEQQQYRGHDCAGEGGEDERLTEGRVDQAALRRRRGTRYDGDRTDAGGRLNQTDDANDVTGNADRGDSVGIEMPGLHGIDEGHEKRQQLLEQRPDRENRHLPRQRKSGEPTGKLSRRRLASQGLRAGQQCNVGVGAGHRWLLRTPSLVVV